MKREVRLDIFREKQPQFLIPSNQNLSYHSLQMLSGNYFYADKNDGSNWIIYKGSYYTTE